MNASPSGRPRLSRHAAEAALVIVALLLMAAAAAGGFLVGRQMADESGEPTAAETATEATTSAEAATTAAETETEGATTQVETETDGEQDGDVNAAAVFQTAGCGGCHTFAPANSTGNVGPNLTNSPHSKDEIAAQIRNGGGGMPAYEGRLSDEEIEALADYVESGG